MTDRRGDGTEHSATRRGVLRAAGAATAGAAAATLFSTGAAAEPTEPTETGTVPAGVSTGDGAFPQSVASGGPTPSGAVVWTRLAPGLATVTGGRLYLQVVPTPGDGGTPNADADFSRDGTRTFTVPTAGRRDGATALAADQDHTVRVDLDGRLEADTFYFYRFVYDAAGGSATASPVGRLRTLPAPDASPDDLRLVVTSCNNYQHGYWGGFAHAAAERADYHVSLGDFLYEYAGAGQQPNRDIELPSGNDVVHTLADFRHQHRVYRSDEHMQAVLERHTLVHTWDDHEIVNNRWWNAEGDYPNTTSHPSYSGEPEAMRRLYARGITALLEYLPLRVDYTDPYESPEPVAESDARAYFRLYRSFRFGDLAELFMTDERLYRSPPPEDEAGQRDVAAPPSREHDDPDRTMLGRRQRDWFLDGGPNPDGLPDTDGVTGTDATWKLHGNEVLSAALKTTNAGPGSFYLNYDAWDGYEAERNLLMKRLLLDDVDNFVTLTGDMHSYVAAYLKQDYRDPGQSEYAGGPRVGVEFMTPAVSSDNLAAAGGLPADATEDAIDATVRSQNPHVEWFNSSRWGYTTVHITDSALTYSAYGVDRSVDSADAPRTLLRSYRVPAGRVELQELRAPSLDAVVGEQVRGTSTGVTESAPDDAGTTTTSGDSDGDGVPNHVEGPSDEGTRP